MLIVGQPQNLGRRTMMLILTRRTAIGFVVFICSIILAFSGPGIAYALASLISLGGQSNTSAITDISNYVASFSVMALLASVILILVGIIIGLIQYRNHVFVLEEFNIKFRTGIFDKSEVSIPYRQIQDINLVRTVMHRIFGVSRLLMITAGREDAKTQNKSDTIFDPVDADLADEIQKFLEHKIGIQVVERVVQEPSTMAGVTPANQSSNTYTP